MSCCSLGQMKECAHYQIQGKTSLRYPSRPTSHTELRAGRFELIYTGLYIQICIWLVVYWRLIHNICALFSSLVFEQNVCKGALGINGDKAKSGQGVWVQSWSSSVDVLYGRSLYTRFELHRCLF